MSASPAIASIGYHASATAAGAGRVATQHPPGQSPAGSKRPSLSSSGADSASISVAALQYQLGEVRSQIERVSANCSTCDPNRVTLLAPLYAKAQTLQALISSSNAAP